ncbi:GNAT family N-acetyltransferase [Robertmurraya yapensis]|uniref:GNAT family N-acetyltransferase n=2 Tax=Bacillaceae TaxID=186817 RepID=A0A3S0K0T7_9BACI|nr:GNAT family N-acetyltransferase [Bacillus yapensis]RTR33146.1 GNAT family N-acetyltransferase [Bacillus yapensis]TKS96969.1 GNAT family N-acetyltransferase [Bacillus yapensis]
MKVEFLKGERLGDFVEYCRMHRAKLDHSFLYDEDLNDFEPNAENPAYIISNSQGEIIAAVSLILDDYNRRGKKARFRIFHSAVNDVACYQMLWQALFPHTIGLEKVFLFIPNENAILIEFIKKLNFTVERYAYLLLREDLEIPGLRLPADYSIRSFRPGVDEAKWCVVRNAGFAQLQGSETPITPEMISEMISKEGYVEGGMMILFHQDRPVGIVNGEADEYEDVPALHIAQLAIIPEYQGRGFGRMLLRAALHFAKENGFKRTTLSVNGENERAISLYIQEDFKQAEAFTCYQYDLQL